ncbi:hypothetical protein WJ971_29760 [Achromobacter xylosoxidans]
MLLLLLAWHLAARQLGPLLMATPWRRCAPSARWCAARNSSPTLASA